MKVWGYLLFTGPERERSSKALMMVWSCGDSADLLTTATRARSSERVTNAFVPFSSKQSRMHTLVLMVVSVPLVSCGTLVKKIKGTHQERRFLHDMNKVHMKG